MGRRQIRDTLDALTHSGVTIFINSHLLAEVESFCEHVAILSKGRLALEGKISALISEGGFTVRARDVADAARQLLGQSGAVLSPAFGQHRRPCPKFGRGKCSDDVIRQAQGLIEASLIPLRHWKMFHSRHQQ